MEIRAEYNAWEIEVLLDFYRFTNENKYLERAIKLGYQIEKVQARNGSFYFDTRIKRVWSGEPGLCAWSLYKLYYYSKNEIFKEMADKAMQYISKHPIKRKKDEKRLYYVFVAWNSYPSIIRWQLFKDKNSKKEFITAADFLISKQKLTGRWTIVLHYDLYVAWVLMHAYHETKNEKYIHAVVKFLRFARLHKTHLGLYPIHYLPIGLIEKGSGYATNQIVRLYYYLYFETMNRKFKKIADKFIPKIEEKLTRNKGIAKLYDDKPKNSLATMWFKHNQLLTDISPAANYFRLAKPRTVTKDF